MMVEGGRRGCVEVEGRRKMRKEEDGKEMKRIEWRRGGLIPCRACKINSLTGAAL